MAVPTFKPSQLKPIPRTPRFPETRMGTSWSWSTTSTCRPRIQANHRSVSHAGWRNDICALHALLTLFNCTTAVIANEAEVKHPSPAENPDEMFLDRKMPVVDRNPALLPCPSEEETVTPVTPPVGSSLNPITFDDDEDEETKVTPDAPKSSATNRSESASIECAATPKTQIRNPYATPPKQVTNPYVTPPRATTTKSVTTPNTPAKRPPTHEESERADAFHWQRTQALRRAYDERAETNRLNALRIKKERAMAMEQASNHQQPASNSVRPRPPGLHREHVFTILRALKRVMDWDEEEEIRR